MFQTSFGPTRVRTALSVAALWLSAMGAAARADMISYSMILCEDINVLKNPNNSTVAHNAAWISQHAIMLERTMPYVELVNTSATDNITEISMTVGDTTKNFDWASIVDASAGVHVTLVTPDAVAGGLKSGVVTLKFTGLAPNDFVRFRLGLSPNDANANPLIDYRQVLFHMNAGSDTSKNSQITVTFGGLGGAGTMTNPLSNFPVAYPTATSMAIFTGYDEDTIAPFTFNSPRSTSGGFVPVPEPDSWVLLAASLLGLAAVRRRGCRAAQPAARM